MTPHQRLGVEQDADERAIKRAYARALRRTRPDEDAQAFQTLHEAYQAALSMLRQAEYERWLQESEAESEQDESVEDCGDAPPASAAESRVDASSAAAADDATFAGHNDNDNDNDGDGDGDGDDRIELSIDQIGNAVILGALRLSPGDYEAWLREFPPLYSLYVKDVIAPQLPRALAQAPQLPSAQLEAIVRFFDLDALGTLDTQGHWLLHRLRQRSGVDFGAFLAELRERCAHRNPESLRNWLMYREEVRDPDLRDYVGALLYRELEAGRGASTLPPDAMQLVCEFFAYPENDPLRLRNNALWALTHEDARAFGHPSPKVVEELKRPYSPWRALRVATLQSELSRAVARLGGQLRQACGELPASIDPRQYLFHARLAYRGYWGPWRWAVYLLRTALVLLPLCWFTDLELAASCAGGVLLAQVGWLAYDSLFGHGPAPPRPIRPAAREPDADSADDPA
ncbi:dnaJ domain [Lysobacter enzymogenes]|uniref:DnaJ domain n=1 Tax=Lysobacter enzymogenes TaxID=69 RepID=A0A0S2DFN8_LYSEN|nr:J domain-containing protein [Lysobacter enzymogenes]ALN57314.1 dnaJ domain [Lysobacter enzymogenes]QCW25944.1 J domain-containing protein [Lysobacter enzymogenes]